MKNFRTTHVFIKETKDMHALHILLKQGFNMMLYNTLFSALDNLLSKKSSKVQFCILLFLK